MENPDPRETLPRPSRSADWFVCWFATLVRKRNVWKETDGGTAEAALLFGAVSVFSFGQQYWLFFYRTAEEL